MHPFLILDLLHNFLNNEISMPVPTRTLQARCDHLRWLSLGQPVTVLTAQSTRKEHELFYSVLAAIADEVLHLVSEEVIVWQPRLF
jgi:hypothetical protein